jgi:DNA-binding GntR family transcriptional regulator
MTSHRHQTLAERIAERLSRLIVNGELAPGTRLVETDLARRLNVSRAPIREAIRALEPLGLVTKRSRRGARVVDLAARDVKEIYEVKTMLDGLAARLAAERITDAEIGRLSALHERMQQLVWHGNRDGYAATSREFHDTIIEAGRNSRLIRMYDAMSQQIWWLGTMVMTRSDRSETSMREHADLLDALRARDGKRAQEAAEHHARRGGEFFFEQFLWGKVGHKVRHGSAPRRPRRRPPLVTPWPVDSQSRRISG